MIISIYCFRAAIWSSSAALRPTVATPSMTAIVAGTAPLLRIVAPAIVLFPYFQDKAALCNDG